MFLIKIEQIGDFIFEGRYSLHSTFNNISNFINDEKNIVSVSHDNKYLSSNSIIIYGLPHTEVKTLNIKKDFFFINKNKFKKSDLVVFKSKINYSKDASFDILDYISSFIEENNLELNHLSLAFLINPKFEYCFETSFQKAFVKYIKSAIYDMLNGSFFNGIKNMKGAGHGLTPSGDDFITGMLYALILIQEIKKIDTKELRNNIYEISKSNNDISRNMIFHASKGLYFKQFKDFQIALLKKDKNIKQIFKNLTEIGETSGSDMITGYFLTIKNRKQIKQWLML